jgi:hypothetical protein
MFKRILTVSISLIYLSIFGIVRTSDAQTLYSAPSNTQVSIFDYGWRGLFLGLLTGFAAGYLRYADANDTNSMLRSAGYGALIGTGVGLFAGYSDSAAGHKATGDVILTDMYRAGWFGLAVGTIWGGIDALTRDDWKALARGAGWGNIGGVVLGLGTGIYEAPRVAAGTTSVTRLMPSIMFKNDSKNNSYPSLRISCSF